MRVTGLGHASVLIETAHGSILTDPWVNPAYFGSWFPFPDNSQLDWDALGRADYLYVCHLHRDHFDPTHLRDHVDKRHTVLLPEFPTTELEDGCASSGSPRSSRPCPARWSTSDGLQVMIQSLTSPTDGPIGDSSLWVYDGDQRLLNQNDARPSDLTRSPSSARSTPTCCSSPARSGSRWSTSCPSAPSRRSACRSGSGSSTGRLRYIEELEAALRLPDRRAAVLPRRGAVGLQRHLRRRVEHLPGPDRLPRVAGRPRATTRDGCCCPARWRTSWRRRTARSSIRCPTPRSRNSSPTRRRTSRDYQARPHARRRGGRRRPGRTPRSTSSPSCRSGSSRCWRRPTTWPPASTAGSGSPAEDAERGDVDFIIDFVAREVRPYAGEKVRYRFRTRRAYLEQLVHDHESRLGQLAVPVLPVLRAPHRAVQRVRLRRSSSACPRSGSTTPRAGSPSRTPPRPARRSRSTAGRCSAAARTSRPT